MVVKGQAYGIRSIRVDGNDALAVYSAIRAAREMVVRQQKPVLVEVTVQPKCVWFSSIFTQLDKP